MQHVKTKRQQQHLKSHHWERVCVCVCWGAIIARYVFKEKRGRMKWCRDKVCRVETNNCNQQLRQEAKIYKDKGPGQRWTRLPGTTTHIWHRNSRTTISFASLLSLNWDIHGRKCQSGAQREKGSKIRHSFENWVLAGRISCSRTKYRVTPCDSRVLCSPHLCGT